MTKNPRALPYVDRVDGGVRVRRMIVLLLALFSVWFATPVGLTYAATVPTNQTVTTEANQQLDTLPTQSIDAFWQHLNATYGGYLPDVSGESLISAIASGHGFHIKQLAHGLIRYFFSELLDNAALLGGILILAVLAALLESMQSAFESQTVSQVANAVIFLVLMVLAIGSFTEAVGYAKHAIQSMSDFMLASVPVLVAVLAATGNVASAAFFSPFMAFAVEIVTNIVFLFVFPLIFFGAVLDITSAISPRYKLTRLAGLLRSVAIGVLGFSLSAFIGISAVSGAGKGIADGVALRATKFGLSTFVPVIGKALSDAWETVASASLLAKNAIGIAGLILVALIALFPALKVLAVAFVYNGSAALMQPLGESPMIPCLASLGKSLVLVFACVAAVAMMFFVSICIMMAAANVAVIMS